MCLPALLVEQTLCKLPPCEMGASYILEIFSHLSPSISNFPFALRKLDGLLIALRNEPAISHRTQQRRRRRHTLPQRQRVAFAGHVQEQHRAIFHPAIARLLVAAGVPGKTIEVDVVAQVMARVVRLLRRHQRWRARRLAQVSLPAGQHLVVLQRRRQDVLAVREVEVAGVGRQAFPVDVGVFAVAVAVREALERVVRAAGRHADVQDEVDGVDVGG